MIRWFLVLALVGFSVSAKEIDVSSLTEKELEKMPEEQRNALPAKVVFAVLAEPMADLYDELIRVALYKRMYAYPNSPPLVEQIKEFQKDIGVDLTGELTFGQATKLLDSSTLDMPTSVYAGGYAKPYIYDDFASVKGTWVIVGDSIATPVNSSEFNCYRHREVCFEFQAELITHSLEGEARMPKDSYNLSTNIESWEVIKWSANEIVAQSDGECRITTITINAKSEEVNQITRNAGGSCSIGAITMPALEQPRIAVLKPGFETTYAYFNELKDSTRTKWSSRFNELMKKRLKATSSE